MPSVSGIYDEDEGEKIAEAINVSREEPPAPPAIAQIAAPEKSADPIEEMITAPAPTEAVEWSEVEDDEPPAPIGFPGDRPMERRV